METTTMGRVVVAARLENLEDVYSQAKSNLLADQIRTVDVTDALIDTGATELLAPRSVIARLGISQFRKRVIKTAAGDIEVGVYRAVRLTVQGRDCIFDVTETSDDRLVIIGRIPLLAMDWVVDLNGRRLIGNPEHGGEWMAECYGDY